MAGTTPNDTLSMADMSNIMQGMKAQYEKDMEWVKTIAAATDHHASMLDVHNEVMKRNVADIKEMKNELKENDKQFKTATIDNDAAMKEIIETNDAAVK